MDRSRDELGATAVEYALMVVAIAAVIVAVVFAIGLATDGNFGDTCDNWIAAAGAGAC
ncbi:MAG: Flp family type IVb pilin [Nocardioidaceae bacterium]